MEQIDFRHPCRVFFVGIGGISMSALAEILSLWGFTVSGSDSQRSPVTDSLEEKGIHVWIGQRKENITAQIDLAIETSAIQPNNPEYLAIRELGIPCLSRADLLGQIMKNYETAIAVSGTHGKTTTTSMIAELLMACDYDPTVLVGGMLPSIGGNLRIGKSCYFLTEACEYTNSFLSFFPKIGIILNIEEDHLDYFDGIDHIRASFHAFARLVPQDGILIVNGDIPDVSQLTRDCLCEVLTFGQDPSNDYQITTYSFADTGESAFTLRKPNHESTTLSLVVPGLHNIYNAAAAFVLADRIGIPSETAADALKHFRGTKRRFERKGEIGGVSIVDDYAHHPTEIVATLTAAKQYGYRQIWCVFQPHTYTRTKKFLLQFAEALALADHIVLADIYAARETDTLGISSVDLLDQLVALGKDCHHFSTFDEIEIYLLENCTKGDLLITMGAGDIVKVGEMLLGPT
ncbi:MAG: UDP-N-acetylmuramate--L-alanine ligase [Lachnospiraceae bacterium]|jgi:UDP-N-acetylmuramate--alanine ligase|nr:UDP-N-acetylmuramate--L-alanine ligase [Lachnospiraceae bacterium]